MSGDGAEPHQAEGPGDGHADAQIAVDHHDDHAHHCGEDGQGGHKAPGAAAAQQVQSGQNQAGQSTTRLQVGNLVLDQTNDQLSTPSGSCRLTNKEFQMLELLMANPRQLISAQRMLERIWGYDSEAEVNVVWVYISYLRKKLAQLGANVAIRASRNAGYSLEELP